MSIYRYIKDYQCISIIGMEKNTGKTETLNRIIQEVGDQKIIGLTSIGRDGEEKDVVSNTAKPRIYVCANTIIATARKCLDTCDITKEILYCSGISTPLGEIVIIRSLSAGYVDIAGGSYNQQNLRIIEKMKEFNCDHIIIDGALSRNSSSLISDVVILATGASLSASIHTVVSRTYQFVQQLSFPTVEDSLYIKIQEFFNEYSLGIIDSNDKIIPIKAQGIIQVSNSIKEHLIPSTKSIVIKTSITDLFMGNLIKHRKNFKEIECIITDGTKCFLSHEMYQKAITCGVKFRVMNKLNIAFMTYNPYSPKDNYTFNNEEFKTLLQKHITIPIFNIRDLDAINR